MSHPQLTDITAPVILFPVRHHSPTAARLVGELIRERKPAAVLIEGPWDFNDDFALLYLDHELPIAIYSHVRTADGGRHGAYHPFCIYSPEWQALRVGHDTGAAVRFIDLPWADIAEADAEREVEHRYSDAELRYSQYIATLCERLNVEDYDQLWDSLIEVEDLTLDDYMTRVHELCRRSRELGAAVSLSNARREAFMTQEIRATQHQLKQGKQKGAQILVVTGGYHSLGIWQRLYTPDVADEPAECHPRDPAADDGEHRGIALTPYSYARLDSLTGYNAGMPSPGFYDAIWTDRAAGHGASETHRRLLGKVATALRARGQPVSAADLIAGESMARGLATLRGHAAVWRRDLVDGFSSALIKEARAPRSTHPLIDALHQVFRGDTRGRLAEGTPRPPLVRDIEARLEHHRLVPTVRPDNVRLDLHTAEDRERSMLLHQLRLLGVAGFSHEGGTDLIARDDLSRIEELWRLLWSPEYESSAIEASRYGTTLADAVGARLEEAAGELPPRAEAAAGLLIDAALAGASVLRPKLLGHLVQVVRDDQMFESLSAALDHLLWLWRYDEVLGLSGRSDIGDLLAETWNRSLWQWEALGNDGGDMTPRLRGVQALLATLERAGHGIGLDARAFCHVATRVQSDSAQSPVLRGAATGALWTLGAADAEAVTTELRGFADPAMFGDYLTGLFALGREAVLRHPDLVRGLDSTLLGYSDDEFLAALPPLRLAFTYFSPREVHDLTVTLASALGLSPEQTERLASLQVSGEEAAAAYAFEGALLAALRRYSVRGAD